MNPKFQEEIAAAKAILTEAKRINRDLTDAERRQLDQHMAKARDQGALALATALRTRIGQRP
jgi:hypothetical protein